MKNTIITFGILLATFVGFLSHPELSLAKSPDANGCTIKNISLDPSGDRGVLQDSVQIPLTLTIESTNCAGTMVGIIVRNKVTALQGYTNPSEETLNNMFEGAVVGAAGATIGGAGAVAVPAAIIGAAVNSYGSVQQEPVWAKYRIIGEDTATIPFLTDTNVCRKDYSGPDCLLTVLITSGGGLVYDSSLEPPLSGEYKDSSGKIKDSKLHLAYECAGIVSCPNSRKTELILQQGETGFLKYNENNELVDPNAINAIDVNSPCYDKDTQTLIEGCNALLAPLPGLTKIDSTVTLGQYVNTLVRIAIGLLVVFAVVVIIIQGLQYITEGSIAGKAMSKEKITNAVIGVLIGLGIFIILATINPALVNLEPGIDEATFDFGGDQNSPSTLPLNLPAGSRVGIGAQNLDTSKIRALGVYCPGTGGKTELPKIIDSIINNKNKFAYSQSLRGQTCEGTKVCTDCSHLTSTIILGCAGITTIKGTHTATMLTSANSPYIEKIESFKVSGKNLEVNGKPVNVGDILGWSINDKVPETRPNKDNPKPGHVVMYAGNARTIEASGSNDVWLSKATTYWSDGSLGKSHRWIIRLP